MIRPLLLFLFLAGPAAAETILAGRAIPSRTILSREDIVVAEGRVPGTFAHPDDVIGLEARTTIYPGRPIRLEDLGAPAVVERNQIVSLRYTVGGLFIQTDGRALGRAGIGDLVRVMNLSSRNTITGRVAESGVVEVGK